MYLASCTIFPTRASWSIVRRRFVFSTARVSMSAILFIMVMAFSCCCITKCSVVVSCPPSVLCNSPVSYTHLDVYKRQLLTYCMNILMSLMMLSMVFVMITMSVASARRVSEVLNEKSNLNNPKHPVMEVKDGSITFDQMCIRDRCLICLAFCNPSVNTLMQ